MDAITNISAEAIDRYFHVLSVLGYKNYSDVSKLFLLTFLEEILTGEMSFYITEDDLRIISNAVSSLCGSTCLISYTCNPKDDGLIHPIKRRIIPRITEDSLIRTSEGSLIRIKL